MKHRDFGKEWWLRFYPRESNEAKGEGVLCRGLRDTLFRYAQPLDKEGNPTDDSGVLVTDRTRERAIQTLMNAMSTHPDEWDQVYTYILTWIDKGFLTWRKRKSRHQLCITNYVAAQTAKSPGAKRTAKWRAKAQRKTHNTKTLSSNDRREPATVTRDASNVTGDVTRDVTRDGRVTTDVDVDVDQRSLRKEIQSGEAKPDVLQVAAQAWLGDAEAQKRIGPIGLAHQADFVLRVVRCCDEVWGTRTLLRTSNDPRVRVVLERVAEGYSPAELEQAIRGSSHDLWLRERKKLHTVTTLLRDADSVDKYLRQTLPQPRKAKPAPASEFRQSADANYYADGGGWEDGSAAKVTAIGSAVQCAAARDNHQMSLSSPGFDREP